MCIRDSNNGVPFKAVLTDGRLVINFDNQYLGFISPNYIYLCAYDKEANVLTLSLIHI